MKSRCSWLCALRSIKSTQTYYTHSQKRRLSTFEGAIESTGKESYGVPEKIQDNDAEIQPVLGLFQPSRGLPLSPIMDPAMEAAVMKYRSPKPPPSKQLNPLQVKLKNNPYAHALAAPVRQCAILKARLPSSFLIRYHLIAHPETGALWYIPQGMTKPAPLAKDPSDPKEQPYFSAPPNGPSSYALSSASLLRHITPERKKRKFFTWELLNRCQTLEVKSGIVWRRDMHEFVLKLLRKRVHNEANYIATRRCFSRCATLDEVQWKKQVGFILWFGRPPSGHRDTPGDKVDAGPTSYTTITTQRPVTEVAVYNLPRLLGSELADLLRHGFGLGPHNEAVVVKSRRSTVNMGMWLWKLEGYLVGFEEGFGEHTED